MALVNGDGNNHSKDISLHFVEKRARIFTRWVSYDHQWKAVAFLFRRFWDVQEAIPKILVQSVLQ